MFGAIDHGARHHAVFQHPPVAIDIAQEKIERQNALSQPTLDAFPFLVGDDARQQIGGNDPFGGAVVVIDGEGDALVQEALLARLLAADQFFQRQGGNAAVERGIRWPCAAIRREHFVIGRTQLVIFVRRILAGARRTGRHGGNIRPAKVLRVAESFMLHVRSVMPGRKSRKTADSW